MDNFQVLKKVLKKVFSKVMIQVLIKFLFKDLSSSHQVLLSLQEEDVSDHI